MEQSNVKKLISMCSANEVEQICRPLFEAFGINSFVYTKVYKKDSYLTLSNRLDWVEHFHTRRYLHPTIDFESLKSGHYVNLQELGIPEEQIITARESFNADYWFNIIKNNKTYYEIIGIATHRGNFDILNFYLNNGEVLEHFYYYFKEKSQDLIKNAEKNKISLRDDSFDPGRQIYPDHKVTDFLKNTQIDRYYILDDTADGYVTKREYQVLGFLSQGRSIKEIADAMGLTPRTIKSYLYNAMNRLGCHSRSQILEILEGKYAAK